MSTMPFIHEDFLLHSETAKRLYHAFAVKPPILDYHCHLPPADVAADRRFDNLFEIWLEGDHYKWRAMRANGVGEELCTGGADPYDKFVAWARTVPHTLRNPLYHWSHLELKRYFGIDDLLDESTAESVWRRANERLAGAGLTAHGILRKFDVRALCTTDDPTDDLAHHRTIAASNLETKVYPAFRPDKALTVNRPEVFNPWVAKLEAASNVEIRDFQSFLDALKQRHDFFHEMGGRLSDHGLDRLSSDFPSDATAAAIFDSARDGVPADAGGTRAIRRLHDGLLRQAGCGARLDQADAFGRSAQQQHARLAHSRPRRRVRLDRRLAASREPEPLPRPPGPARRAAADDRLQQQPQRQLPVCDDDGGIFRTARSPEKCSSAPAGGTSTRKRRWSGR